MSPDAVRLWMTPMSRFTCSYTPPDGEVHSSLDAFGMKYNYLGFVPGDPVYPSTSAGLSGSPTIYGTPNDGDAWGIAPGVIEGPLTITARWVWDLETFTEMCALRLVQTAGGGYLTSEIQGSNNGTAWTTVVTVADYIASGASSSPFGPGDDAYHFPEPYPKYRYWAFHFSWTMPLGGLHYFDGIDMNAFMLWPVV